jgi:tetratricopeptide (TPR) repeat protein
LALLSPVQRVEAHLSSGAGGPDVRRRAEQLLRDVHMLAHLDEIRLRQAETKNGEMFNVSGAEARYAAAFPEYGIDVLALDEPKAATRLRDSAIHEALLSGLDGWIQTKPAHDPDRARLRRVADAADDNAWRRAFREAALAGDDQKLKTLAGRPEALAQPAVLLAWLGSVLDDRGLENEAAVLLRQAQHHHPADFWINYNLGHALILGLNHPEEAVGYCRAAVAIRPSSAEAHSLLGVALARKGDSDAAIAAYQHALALDPKFAIARNNLVAALVQKGDLNGAVTFGEKAIKLDPKYPYAHAILGTALSKQGKLDEAITCCTKAIELDPENAWFWRWRGTIYSDFHQYDKGAADFARAIKLKPDEATMHYWHALACLALHDLPGYRSTCAAMVKQFGRTEKPDAADCVAWTCALASGAVDDWKSPLRLAQQASRGDPKNATFSISLGAVLFRAGRIQEAIQELEKKTKMLEAPGANAVQTSPAYPWFFLALAHQHRGNADEARRCLDKAAELADRELNNQVPWNRKLTVELLRREARAAIVRAEKK